MNVLLLLSFCISILCQQSRTSPKETATPVLGQNPGFDDALPPNASSQSGLSQTALIGLIIGLSACIAIVIIMLFLVLIRKKNHLQTEKENQPDSNEEVIGTRKGYTRKPSLIPFLKSQSREGCDSWISVGKPSDNV